MAEPIHAILLFDKSDSSTIVWDLINKISVSIILCELIDSVSRYLILISSKPLSNGSMESIFLIPISAIKFTLIFVIWVY